jgi:hypothetical protein
MAHTLSSQLAAANLDDRMRVAAAARTARSARVEAGADRRRPAIAAPRRPVVLRWLVAFR